MIEADDPGNRRTNKTGRARRPPPPVTASYLRRWALHYLERYSAASAHLRRLMLVKIARSNQLHGEAETADSAAVDSLIIELTGLGLLNDSLYAASQARRLQRRGLSARAMRGRLAQRGLSQDAIAQALEALQEDTAEPELAAALTYARRRRLGPHRPDSERAERRERDLAVLSRRGFTYDVARRVIDAEDLATLEDEAHAERH